MLHKIKTFIFFINLKSVTGTECQKIIVRDTAILCIVLTCAGVLPNVQLLKLFSILYIIFDIFGRKPSRETISTHKNFSLSIQHSGVTFLPFFIFFVMNSLTRCGIALLEQNNAGDDLNDTSNFLKGFYQYTPIQTSIPHPKHLWI